MADEAAPTLGDLRRALTEDPPPPDCELSFDIPGTAAPALGYLPDAIFVPRRTIERVESGGYDYLPDTCPLEEL